MSEREFIMGVHSIAQAIKNNQRTIHNIVGSEEGFKELYKRGGIDPKELGSINLQKVASHKVQELAKEEFKSRELSYQRVPSQIFAITSCLELFTVKSILDDVTAKKKIKILALDQVTDTHNAGAIMRTAAFYGVDYLITAQKGAFGFTPSFYRIASGATEFVKVVKAASLPKLLNKLNTIGIDVIGLSEHASDNDLSSNEKSICLVLGSEDTGMSNAVSRIVNKTISLESKGGIKSLNVSVAAAVAMEKLF